MATKTKICEEEIGETEKKQDKAISMEDRLSSLPHDLQIRILSSLHDTKLAVQSSMLFKRWDSLCRWLPVLDCNCSADLNYNVDVFDKFVDRILCLRDPSAKLDRLTFTRPGYSITKILKRVFDYAFAHGVKQLEAEIIGSCNGSWPVRLDASFESLTSLRLQSGCSMSCPFLGPKSGSFKNLTVLYLNRAIIRDADPFSGFPVLESLTLVYCFITYDDTLNVHARNLSDLTICSCYQNLDCCELITPRLRSFDFKGCKLPLFRIHEGLPVLDTMVITLEYGGYRHTHNNITFNNLLNLFCTIDNVKSLTLHYSTVQILMSLFREELVERSLPFRNLKCLKLDFRNDFPRSSISTKIVADVKLYLLQNSPPDAQVIPMNLVSCDV